MIIIRPQGVTDAKLDSSNVAENDESEWDSGTGYNEGDLVMETASGVHKIYEATAEAGNTNKYPPDYADTTIPTPDTVYWTEKEPTNRWAMFTGSISTQTTNATTIEVDITPGQLINGIALFNLDAETVQIVGNDPTDGEVYNTTTNLQTATIDSWYSFFYEERTYAQDMVALDLPVYPSATYTITISKTGTAACGYFTMGRQRDFGDCNYGTSVGIIDYSIKTQDQFGVQSITQRNYSKRVEYDITIDTGFVAEVQRVLAEFRATPCAWIGDQDFESTIVFGYYRDFDIVLSNPALSSGSISVEGLT